MKSKLALLIGFFSGCLALSAVAQNPQEGVFLDPQTGDYRVRYLDNGAMVEGVFFPHTKIDPSIKSKLRIANDDYIEYRYKVRNRKAGRQDIDQLILYVSSASTNGLITPSRWSGGVSPNIGGVGDIVGWDSRIYKYGIGVVTDKNDPRWNEPATLGIAPGGEPSEFGIKSRDLPGIGVIRYLGATGITRLPGEGPDPESPVGKAYHDLRLKDFVPRPAAIPRISNPVPFDAVIVLTDIQKHIKTDMLSMQLADAALVAQLDPWFTSAIDAAKRNNREGLRHAIESLRKLLKQEHTDVDKDDDSDRDEEDEEKKSKSRIDKLAARILDFDLKYVEKQVKGNKK